MIALYRRFLSLDRSHRRLVCEAATWIAVVWAGLRLFRFLTLRRILDRSIPVSSAATVSATPPNAIDSVRWAIAAVAPRFPPATCLVRALAAEAMLRHRRIAAEVRLGVRLRRGSPAPIEAHAWVECTDGATIGALEDQSEYTVLTAARTE